jgi:F-type H+-transporting ATPase subunit delta
MKSEVARRYARAFYDLAKTASGADKAFAELRILREAISTDSGIKNFLLSPVVDADKKASALKLALHGKASDSVTNGLLLLAHKNRLNLFFDIVDAFEEISDLDHGVTRGTVKSAKALGPEARNKIEATVNKVTGKKVILNYTEDADLLGGMMAQVGGWTFDDSLETHLTRMSEDLNRRTH